MAGVKIRLFFSDFDLDIFDLALQYLFLE